jgi:hypothetical protein
VPRSDSQFDSGLRLSILVLYSVHYTRVTSDRYLSGGTLGWPRIANKTRYQRSRYKEVCVRERTAGRKPVRPLWGRYLYRLNVKPPHGRTGKTLLAALVREGNYFSEIYTYPAFLFMPRAVFPRVPGGSHVQHVARVVHAVCCGRDALIVAFRSYLLFACTSSIPLHSADTGTREAAGLVHAPPGRRFGLPDGLPIFSHTSQALATIKSRKRRRRRLGGSGRASNFASEIDCKEMEIQTSGSFSIGYRTCRKIQLRYKKE